MLFKRVAETFSEIEKKSGRIEITEMLAELFKECRAEELEKIVYFIEGIIAPPYFGIELGMGERFVIESIAKSTGYSKKEIENLYLKEGDLGIACEKLLEKKKQQSLISYEMDVLHVFNTLKKIAMAEGKGSQALKIKLLVELLNNAKPIEGKYIVRFALGQLRLKVGDPTILDALSVAKRGDKELREELERAYNLCSDLGYVAKTLFTDPEKIREFKIEVFRPIRPALAERLPSAEDIIKKLKKCAVEYKFDGFRMQIHKKNEKVEIYSRKLEKITYMFPDIVESVKSLKEGEIIFEGEALAYDKSKERFYSFQETMHRRRKYGIEESARKYPLQLFVFDILYLNGKDLTVLPYKERRKMLEKIFPHKNLHLTKNWIVENSKEIKRIFNEAIKKGLEGIMAKDLNALYTAGARKFAWVKLKKSYGAGIDTVDAVIVGYYAGKGARTELFGGVLVAVLNEKTNKLETIAKIGSGYSESEMIELRKKLEKIRTLSAPSNLEHKIDADYWVVPKYVVEVGFDEISRSPTHTCMLKEDKGYALRFPRIIRIREDKGIEEITTSQEIEKMFLEEHKLKR